MNHKSNKPTTIKIRLILNVRREGIRMNDYYEIQKEKELIEQTEKETFQELNGFSDEENEYISWKYQ